MPSIPEMAMNYTGDSADSVVKISPSDIVIAIIGITGVGKSTFINYFSDIPVQVGHDLASCTGRVEVYPCTLPDGTRLFLVDTPGFDDTYKTDTDILREVANWLSEAYQKAIKLTGIVYLHRILDVRMGGAAMKNLRMFKALCGDDSLGSVVLATTWWANVTPEVGRQREEQLCSTPAMWKNMIEKGSRIWRLDRDEESALEIIHYLIEKKRPVTLDIQIDMVENGKTLSETPAGQEVQAEIEKQRQAYQKKIEDLQRDMQEAMAQKDRERQEELDQFKLELEDKLVRAAENEKMLRVEREELKREMEAEARRDREELLEKIRQKEKLVAREEARLEAMKQQHNWEMSKQRYELQLQQAQAERSRLQAELDRERECIVM